jgi:uncharacterized C2H2 Zn-finger protein
VICHKDCGLHIHHIIPRWQGGKNTVRNLVTLCSGCHRSVESGDIKLAVYKCVLRAIKTAKNKTIYQIKLKNKRGSFKCGWCGMVFNNSQIYEHLEKIHSDYQHRKIIGGE